MENKLHRYTNTEKDTTDAHTHRNKHTHTHTHTETNTHRVPSLEGHFPQIRYTDTNTDTHSRIVTFHKRALHSIQRALDSIESGTQTHTHV